MPLPLSVVMPAYNAARHMGEAVESLRRQTRTDFELVIVNDGSTDDTGALADALAAEREHIGPRITVLHQTNQGPSAARNAGLAAARGHYIGFLDADDRWLPDKVERHLQVLDRAAGIDLTFSWFRFVAEDGRDLLETFAPAVAAPGYLELLRWNIIHTSTVIGRREAVTAAGGFDPGLSSYEDFDLWLRIARQRPDNLLCLREVLVDYRRRAGQITCDWRRMNEGWESVFAKHLRLDPHLVRAVKREARGSHLQYCSSLAFNAGDHGEARRLMLAAWRSAGRRFLLRRSALWMSAICLATILPRPAQLALGRASVGARWLGRRVHERFARVSELMRWSGASSRATGQAGTVRGSEATGEDAAVR